MSATTKNQVCGTFAAVVFLDKISEQKTQEKQKSIKEKGTYVVYMSADQQGGGVGGPSPICIKRGCVVSSLG